MYISIYVYIYLYMCICVYVYMCICVNVGKGLTSHARKRLTSDTASLPTPKGLTSDTAYLLAAQPFSQKHLRCLGSR